MSTLHNVTSIMIVLEKLEINIRLPSLSLDYFGNFYDAVMIDLSLYARYIPASTYGEQPCHFGSNDEYDLYVYYAFCRNNSI